MTYANLVEQSEWLVKAMGYWPSFHDANVLSISRTPDSCTARIHVFQMTPEVDSKGFFVLRNHHLVEIAMLGVWTNSLPEPYSGDVLSALDLSQDADLIRVDFQSHMDNDGSVVCERVRVVSLAVCDGDGIVGN